MNIIFFKQRLVLFLLCWSGTGAVLACQTSNANIEAMAEAQIVAVNQAEKTVQTGVRLADNDQLRAAGFQYVCASVIAEKPILFLFPDPRVPRFHMHNVVASIDIAFIREDGVIDSIRHMQPYLLISTQRPLYSPDGLVIAALETRPGWFADHQIKVGDSISWTTN